MSVIAPVKKTYSKYGLQESSNLERMSEHLTDSNILCSKKTYGKKKDYRNLSIFKDGGSFSASISEQLKNNTILLSSNYSEELHAEKDFESVTSNYSENSNIQKSNVNSEICLFNDEDTDYYFSISADSPKDHDSFPSTPEVSSSGSNYQRTRKNLKNQLSNQQYSSEETSGSTSHEENSNFINDSKSASNFLSLKQTSFTKRTSLVSFDNQVVHTKKSLKAGDDCVNKLPQNPILFQMANQAGKMSGKGTMLQNPPKNSSNVISILDLVSRFAASNNQAPQKPNPRNKRKRTRKECESISAEKTSIVKHSVSSKVNFIEKKISNSAISIENYNKSVILKSDIKSPLKIPKHHQTSKRRSNESADNMKESIRVIKSVNDISVSKKDFKTSSKTVQKGSNRSVNSTERSVQVLQKYASKNEVVKNFATPKMKCPSPSSLASSDRNETAKKILSDNGDQQIENLPFVQSEEGAVQNQALNSLFKENVSSKSAPLLPMIIAPIPPISQESVTGPLWLWAPSIIKDDLIQSGKHAVSYDHGRDPFIPVPSLNNADSSLKANDYCMNNLCAENTTTTTTTTTTIINQIDIGCDQQKRFFRPRTHINEGIDFHRFMLNSLKKIENNSFLKCKEECNRFFSMNPSLLSISVKEFFDSPSVTDVLLDYVNELDMDKPLPVPSLNKGYDFPENFENEDLLRVIKDFVHTAISYMIPTNGSKPLYISYSRIVKAAMLKMSNREFIVIMQVFKKAGTQLFKLKDVCARLSLVALYVIFDEYKNKRQCR